MTHATVLIVDDELIVRRVVSAALTRVGYHVELASNGMDALQRLSRPGIDLLLLDLQLGDIDGVQVMEAAREAWPSLPIVMLTAHGSLPSAIAAVRCSVADYLLKPINVECLRESISKALASVAATHARDVQIKTMSNQMRAFLHSQGLLHEVMSDLPAETCSDTVYTAGPLRIEVRRHIATLHGQTVEVTPTEFVILSELLRQPGAVISCLQLAQATGTPVADEEEARQLIRPHIVRLRRKLEVDPQQPRFMLSVRGIGYRWSDIADAAPNHGDEGRRGDGELR
jgi:DNA-binding response OmpR family regulator